MRTGGWTDKKDEQKGSDFRNFFSLSSLFYFPNNPPVQTPDNTMSDYSDGRSVLHVNALYFIWIIPR